MSAQSEDGPPPVGGRHREALRGRRPHRDDHGLRLPDRRARGRGRHPAHPRRATRSAQVMLGYDTTVRVSMDEMLHHTKAVVRGSKRALIVGDMPFLSYATTEDAVANAGRFLREGGAQAVKIEGGVRSARTIEALVRAGIPVMGHIGLTPQAINAIGRVRVQGKNKEQARALLADALAVQEAGAFAIVLELVPGQLAEAITERLRIPTIGIGAGAGCTGQIQVITDTLGLGDWTPRHARKYADLRGDDPRGDPRLPRRTWRRATFPAPAETVLMDPAVLDEVLGRTDAGPCRSARGSRTSPASRSTATSRLGHHPPATGPTPHAGRPNPRRAPGRAGVALRGRSASCPRWAGSTPATSRSSSGLAPRAPPSSSRSSSTRASSAQVRGLRAVPAQRGARPGHVRGRGRGRRLRPDRGRGLPARLRHAGLRRRDRRAARGRGAARPLRRGGDGGRDPVRARRRRAGVLRAQGLPAGPGDPADGAWTSRCRRRSCRARPCGSPTAWRCRRATRGSRRRAARRRPCSGARCSRARRGFGPASGRGDAVRDGDAGGPRGGAARPRRTTCRSRTPTRSRSWTRSPAGRCCRWPS